MDLMKVYLWMPVALLTHYDQCSLRWKCLKDQFLYEYEMARYGKTERKSIDDVRREIQRFKTMLDDENPEM